MAAAKRSVLFVAGEDRWDPRSMVLDMDQFPDRPEIERDMRTMMEAATIIDLGSCKVHFLSRPFVLDESEAPENQKIWFGRKPSWWAAFQRWVTCCEHGKNPDHLEPSDYDYIRMQYPYPHRSIGDVVANAVAMNDSHAGISKRSYDVIIAVECTYRPEVRQNIISLLKANRNSE